MEISRESLTSLIIKAGGVYEVDTHNNGFIDLPNSVDNVEFLSKFVKDKSDIEIRNWGSWVKDISANRYESDCSILMQTVKIELNKCNLYLGMTGSIGGKELHWRVEDKN